MFYFTTRRPSGHQIRWEAQQVITDGQWPGTVDDGEMPLVCVVGNETNMEMNVFVWRWGCLFQHRAQMRLPSWNWLLRPGQTVLSFSQPDFHSVFVCVCECVCVCVWVCVCRTQPWGIPQDIKLVGWSVFYSMGIGPCFYITLARKMHLIEWIHVWQQWTSEEAMTLIIALDQNNSHSTRFVCSTTKSKTLHLRL